MGIDTFPDTELVQSCSKIEEKALIDNTKTNFAKTRFQKSSEADVMKMSKKCYYNNNYTNHFLLISYCNFILIY